MLFENLEINGEIDKKCNKQQWKSKVIKGNNLKKSIEYVIQWNAIHWRNFFSYMQNIFMLLYVNFCWWDKEKRIQIWINNRITTFNHYVSWKWKFLKISRNFTITISKITKMNCIFIFFDYRHFFLIAVIKISHHFHREKFKIQAN